MDYVSIQDELVVEFLQRLGQSPQGLRDGLHWFVLFPTFSSLLKRLICAHRLVARYVLKIVYNHEVADPETDPVIQVNVLASNAFSSASNPASLVNIFPKGTSISPTLTPANSDGLFALVLLLPEWIPGTSFFAQARAWQPLVRAMSDVPFEIVKNAIVSLASVRRSDRADIAPPPESKYGAASIGLLRCATSCR